MKLETLKNQWQSAVKAYSTTRERLQAVFQSAVDTLVGKSKTKANYATLRDYLVKWAVAVGVKELTAKAVVTGLMLAHGLRTRAAAVRIPKARRAQIATIVEFLHDEFKGMEDTELVNLLQATLRQLRKS